LVDGYISILHGFIPDGGNTDFVRGDSRKEKHALQMFHYI